MNQSAPDLDANNKLSGRWLRLDQAHGVRAHAQPAAKPMTPTAASAAQTPLIVDQSTRLDVDSAVRWFTLDSSEPLPETLLRGADADAILNRRSSQRPSEWIQESLIYGCPDCSAPLAIRRWLMAAECWQCGAAIEVTFDRSI